MLRQTSVPTVIDSFYLIALGIYRFLYILNYILKTIEGEKFDVISLIFGIVQTALYLDFAWVYWSRQRVKLRGGGIVDSDDLSKSFLVRRLIGKRGNQNGADDGEFTEEDAALARQENGTIRPGGPDRGNSWGPRGISVSADDTLATHQGDGAADAQMVDPSHFEDEDYDDDADAPPPPAKDEPPKAVADEESEDEVHSSATEWQDDRGTLK